MENRSEDNSLETLETPETVESPANGGSSSNENESNSLESSSSSAPEAVVISQKKSFGRRVQGLVGHFNVYLLLFLFIVLISAAIVIIGIQRNRQEATPTTIVTQPLTQEEIDQLSGSEAKVGDPKQTLSIESNAVFTGKVLIRDSLDVAGTIKVGGSLSLPGISVSGTSNFEEIQANSLAIAGNTTILGSLNVNGINSTGGGTFGGPLSAPTIVVDSLQLAGDLQVTRHIDAGGGTPSKSDGTALGNGGTASLSGTDTAGTATINTGSATAPGCFVTVTFATRYNGTPHIVASPIGSAAGSIDYYINRSATSFSICTATAAPSGQSFSFDYIVID